jgi:hypothetical protein
MWLVDAGQPRSPIDRLCCIAEIRSAWLAGRFLRSAASVLSYAVS